MGALRIADKTSPEAVGALLTACAFALLPRQKRKGASERRTSFAYSQRFCPKAFSHRRNLDRPETVRCSRSFSRRRLHLDDNFATPLTSRPLRTFVPLRLPRKFDVSISPATLIREMTPT